LLNILEVELGVLFLPLQEPSGNNFSPAGDKGFDLLLLLLAEWFLLHCSFPLALTSMAHFVLLLSFYGKSLARANRVLASGMGEQTLSVRINKPLAYARELLAAHRGTYRKFWAWSEAAVNIALFRGRLWTRFGWQVHPSPAKPKKPGECVGRDPNTRSLANFPCQANAADMLRLAACEVVERGLML
jgi:hypothetical protein